MLQKRAHQQAKHDALQRPMFLAFGVVLLLSAAIFCFVGFQIVARAPREIPAGHASDYRPNVPQRFETEKLEVSSRARQRPALSDDIVFVVRSENDTWRAFLGLDMQTGCFLNWDAPSQLFVAADDPQCLAARYTLDGRYLDGMPMDNITPQPMAQLYVEVRADGSVVVLDNLVQTSVP